MPRRNKELRRFRRAGVWFDEGAVLMRAITVEALGLIAVVTQHLVPGWIAVTSQDDVQFPSSACLLKRLPMLQAAALDVVDGEKLGAPFPAALADRPVGGEDLQFEFPVRLSLVGRIHSRIAFAPFRAGFTVAFSERLELFWRQSLATFLRVFAPLRLSLFLGHLHATE